MAIAIKRLKDITCSNIINTRSVKERSETKRQLTVMYYYLITIRKSNVKDYVSVDELLSVLGRFKELYPNADIVDKGFEAHGAYMQLHTHFIVCTSKKLYYKLFNQYEGYTVHYTPMNVDCAQVMLRTMDYIHKYDWNNKYVLEQILDCNYYRYNYGF